MTRLSTCKRMTFGYSGIYFLCGLILISIHLIAGCSERNEGNLTTKEIIRFNDISSESWKALSRKRVFFGHHSVGRNILQGIREIMNDRPDISLNLKETETLAFVNGPLFAHYRVGENLDPYSKIDHFREILKNALTNGGFDIAFFKMCYVDIDSNTDIQKVFDYYKRTLIDLELLYPNTIFIHFTVPLKASPLGLKTWVKRLIGYPVKWTDPQNIRRNEFNQLVLRAYEGNKPVFDLAMWESTYPNGNREYFRKNGEKHYTLVPEYTFDGGHLNEKGRRVIAEKLLAFLGTICEARN